MIRNVDGIILFSSNAFSDLYGWSPEELRGKADYVLFQTQFPKHRDEIHAEVLNNGSWRGELKQIKRDGSTLRVLSEWQRVASESCGASILQIDREITASKQGCESHGDVPQKQGERAAAELQAIMDAVPAAIVIVSDADDGYIIGNEMAEKLSGVPHGTRIPINAWDQISGVRYRSMNDGREIKPYDLPARVAARTRRAVRDAEVEVALPNGQKAYLLGDAVPVSTGSACRGAVGAFLDVTELRTKERLLEESRDRIGLLTDRLLTAHDDEKRNIAQDLHDDLSQKLALLAFQIQSLAAESPERSEPVRQGLRLLHERVTGISEDVRNLAYRLYPSVVDDLGLSAALQELCTEFYEMEGIEVTFRESGNLNQIPTAIASCVYRITQEALQNIAKHAQSSTARVTALIAANSVELAIEDAGVGFDPARVKPGIGLLSMEERARRLHGFFRLEADRAEGTRITVQIPVPAEMHRSAGA